MATTLESAFGQMGVRVRIAPLASPSEQRRPWNGRPLGNRQRRAQQPVRIDVLRDGRGEYFDVRRRSDVSLSVPDVVPDDRHLVLMAQPTGLGDGSTSAFLCGHDERAWFVAAVPEEARVRTVQDAKDALKPQEVWDAMKEFGVPMEERDQRRTAAFVRQGEWFFIPCPELQVDWSEVVYNEPIQRGAGKPHRCEAMYRYEGERVYVSANYPNGVTWAEFRALPDSERRSHRWEDRVRGAEVYVRGKVRHNDHATIVLPFWHKVVMNTETKSRAMEHVAFLD